MNFLYLKKLISPLFFLLPLLLSILLFGNSSIPKRYIAPAAQLPGSRPDSSQWKELIRMDPTLVLDIRYASTNNFIGEKIYDCAKCYLRPAVAEALLKVQQALRKKGYGLKLFDCYRPHPAQWALWKKVPDPQYVADPRKGSMHNRGSAVDLTVVDSKGKELDMGTPYDFFGVEAHIDYTGMTPTVRANRKILQDLMIAHGFRTTRTEWWHFSYTRASYPISSMVWDCP